MTSDENEMRSGENGTSSVENEVERGREEDEGDKRDGSSENSEPSFQIASVVSLGALESAGQSIAPIDVQSSAIDWERGPPFTCTLCGRAYAKCLYLRTHQKKKHLKRKRPVEGEPSEQEKPRDQTSQETSSRTSDIGDVSRESRMINDPFLGCYEPSQTEGSPTRDSEPGPAEPSLVKFLSFQKAPHLYGRVFTRKPWRTSRGEEVFVEVFPPNVKDDFLEICEEPRPPETIIYPTIPSEPIDDSFFGDDLSASLQPPFGDRMSCRER